MGQTAFHEDQQTIERSSRVIIDEALFIYQADLENGIISSDIVGKNGFNYSKNVSLSAPFTIDEFNSASYIANNCIGTCSYEKCTPPIACEILKAAYNDGLKMIEETYYCKSSQEYHRMTYTLHKDSATGHIIAFVFCIDVTDIERQKVKRILEEKQNQADLENVLHNAGVGMWTITIFDGEKPRMTGTTKMYELLGLSNPELMTQESIYDAWYSRIKKSALPLVHASVDQMIKEGYSENTYSWEHPDKGEIFVRCGGTSKKVEGKGYILKGYHSDVTSIVTSDIKQKQLLADALAETKRQKQLLQQALDDYKQADYDRRTDFLTGLHNRQDMYEMLNDPLSGKRTLITAMFMMDIDNFKMLNDNYGHQAGDECLRRIGRALTEYGEKNGISFYRYGGEEVLGISFDCEKTASAKAEEIVRLIYDLYIKRDDLETGRVTISLGYTAQNTDYEKMIDLADGAMYRAKSHGKNRCICAD